MKTHLVIPDTQIRPGVCLNHLNALGNFIIKKQPDVIVQLGDWADMHSLSSYDMGTKAGEGARYEEDILASTRGMETLFSPIKKYNKDRARHHRAKYNPSLHLTLGNHEDRINRHINAYPFLAEKLSIEDLNYRHWGWKVYDYLRVAEIDSIAYSHFFPRNAQGRIVQTYRGAPNAALQVQREGRSSTSGHLQGLDVHFQQRHSHLDIGIIAGSFYMHDEDYLCPQGTAYWRGVIVKHEVENGQYDPMFVSLRYLLSKYWDGKEYTA